MGAMILSRMADSIGQTTEAVRALTDYNVGRERNEQGGGRSKMLGLKLQQDLETAKSSKQRMEEKLQAIRTEADRSEREIAEMEECFCC